MANHIILLYLVQKLKNSKRPNWFFFHFNLVLKRHISFTFLFFLALKGHNGTLYNTYFLYVQPVTEPAEKIMHTVKEMSFKCLECFFSINNFRLKIVSIF